MFLLGLILGELQPLLCQPREAIYFWRISEDNVSDIYYKPLKPDLPAEKFKPLNDQADCIACHTIAADSDVIAAVADGSNGPISILRLDGTQVQIPPVYGSYLSFSPDGTQLAFAKDGKDIYILDIATGVSAPLKGASEPGVTESMPSWSPDLNPDPEIEEFRIAFVRTTGEATGYAITSPCDIYTIPSTGGVAIILPGASGDGFNYYPAFSPDGRWLAFTRHTEGSTTRSDPKAEIFVVPAAGGQAIRLQANDLGPGQPLEDVSNSWPTWSPDGGSLAFNSKRRRIECNQFDIFTTTINPDGTSGDAALLEEASRLDSFEHLPQWGNPPRPNVLKNILNLWPWLIPLVLLILLAWWLCQRRKYPHTVELEREVEPESGFVNEQWFDVRMTMYGDNNGCDEIKVRKDVDVILVIDNSVSMADNVRMGSSGTKLEGAKKAAITFIDNLDVRKDRVGLIVFSDEARVLHSLEAEQSLLKTAVNGIETDSGTAIDQGLSVALQEIIDLKRAKAIGAVILLSDGESESSSAIEQAELVKNQGIRLITVGFGKGADNELLEALASSAKDCHFSASNKQLEDLYRSLADQIQEPVAATNLVYKHQINADEFELDPQSIRPLPDDDVIEGLIIWRFDDLGLSPRAFSYRVKARQVGDPLNIDREDRIDYFRCGDKEVAKEIFLSAGLPVTVKERRHFEVIAVREPPLPLGIAPKKPVWQPDSALMIGVGQFGRNVLTQLKKNLADAGSGEIDPQLQFLLLDTGKYLHTGKPYSFAGVELNDSEVITLEENLQPLIEEQRDSPEKNPELSEWFHPESIFGTVHHTTLAEGTHAQRPLARTGLIRMINGKSTRRNGKLLDLLENQVTQVQRSRHGVRVILVGSLGDGMSGVLWDMAYLVREVVRQNLGEDVATHVEGYFPLETKANPNLATTTNELNAISALRELTWLQLNPNLPFDFNYGEGAPEWLQPLRTRLIDDLYVFTEQSADEILASQITDLITLRLDLLSRMGEDNPWFMEARNSIIKNEKDYRQLFYGTGANYVIRLPANDIIEMITYRWARELLHIFLVGYVDNSLDFSMEHVEDPGLPPDPISLVQGFLSGQISDDFKLDVNAPNELVLTSQMDPIESVVSEDKLRERLSAYLNSTLYLILMGTSHNECIRPRAGKIIYTVEFLNQLSSYLELTVSQSIDSSSQSESEKAKSRVVLNLTATVVHDTREQFENLYQILIAVYESLQHHEKYLKERIKTMNAVENRLFLWNKLVDPNGEPLENEKPLYEIWYQDISESESLDDYVEQLIWNSPNGKPLDLAIVLNKEEELITTILDETNPDKFTDQLVELAKAALVDLWDFADLSDYPEDLLFAIKDKQQDVINKTYWNEEYYLLSSLPKHPLQRFAIARSDDLKVQMEEFESALDETIDQSKITTTRLSLSDPLSWQIIRSADGLSPFALRRYEKINEVYTEDDEFRSIFSWDALNKRLSSEFGNVMLHPVVAAALIDRQKAKLYALAFASDWIKQAEGKWGIQVDQSSSPIYEWGTPSGWDSKVYGLLDFVYRSPDETVEQLERNLKQYAPTLMTRWSTIASQSEEMVTIQVTESDTKSLDCLAWWAVRKYGKSFIE